jgi:3-oxoacyl-[acyl-carrier-protein] synthase-3
MTVGIGMMRCLLPGDRVPVTDLPEFASLGYAQAEFARASGVRTVGVFTNGSAAELVTEACRELLASHSTAAPDVLLVVGPRALTTLLCSNACRAQAKRDGTSAFALTIDGLGCTGSSAAWALGRDLLLADPNRQSVLIAHASRPMGVDRVRYPVAVIGDGAYAMTLVRGGRPVLRAHRMETDGSFHDLLQVDCEQAPWREEFHSPDRYRFELAMHSRLRLGRLVDEVLVDAGVTKNQLTATLMQNVTASAYDFYSSLLDLPIHQVCREHLAECGHLGAMDVVLNLDRLLASGELAAGDLVLVLNNNPVAAWAATLWEV